VLTQIMGVSGRAILKALIDGEQNPDKLVALVRPGVKASPEMLRAALQGRVTERHRFRCACICVKSMGSKRPSPKSMRRWIENLPPFGRQSNSCGPSPASVT
jgi:hypothetical protein